MEKEDRQLPFAIEERIDPLKNDSTNIVNIDIIPKESLNNKQKCRSLENALKHSPTESQKSSSIIKSKNDDFICTYCNKRFLRRTYLNLHIRM